jgi:hypothetical protein
MSILITKRSPGTVLGILALIVALAGAGAVAMASVPGGDGSITGCYKTASPHQGTLRVIDAEAGQSCARGELRIRFAAVDSNGKVANADRLDGLDSSAYRLSCPAGTSLFLGVCLEDRPRGADEHANATRDCADEARRLPSEGEMRAYRAQPGITIAPFEWTDELSDTDVASGFLYAIVGSEGSAVDEGFGNDYPYRCVAGPQG